MPRPKKSVPKKGQVVKFQDSEGNWMYDRVTSTYTDSFGLIAYTSRHGSRCLVRPLNKSERGE